MQQNSFKFVNNCQLLYSQTYIPKYIRFQNCCWGPHNYLNMNTLKFLELWQVPIHTPDILATFNNTTGFTNLGLLQQSLSTYIMHKNVQVLVKKYAICKKSAKYANMLKFSLEDLNMQVLVRNAIFCVNGQYKMQNAYCIKCIQKLTCSYWVCFKPLQITTIFIPITTVL